MQILASRFIYPQEQENLTGVLFPFKDMAVQLSFFKHQDFYRLDHDSIKGVCAGLNINIPAIHAPTVDVFDYDFLKIIEEIKRIYKTGLITIHPQKGETNSALAKLEEFSAVLEELEVILAYENFPSSAGKRKWICEPFDMYLEFNLPFLKLTFDTSHLDSPENCIEEFKAVAGKAAIIHLSDVIQGRQHQPLGSGCVPSEQFLKYLQTINFSGPVVIEYMQEYEEQLIKDARRISEDFPEA